ncbi:MAG TPA: LysM peptidoglycan-binding domain-containing protein [Allosphingosinicella sp.]
MVAIFTGTGTGLERGSAMVLGSRGQIGSAPLGRAGEGVYVNAANGNLVITRQDEILIGKGPDSLIARTYNSQATSDGDNNDDWQASVYRKIAGAYGDATVKRMDWDGSDTVYTRVGTSTVYVTTDGQGAYDTLTWSTSTSQWTWDDGDSSISEIYDSAGTLLNVRDKDVNILTYTYPSGKVRATTANGEYTELVYAGTLLTHVVTQTATALTRVYYEYDGSNRLLTVKVNLDPADNSKTTGTNYSLSYTYDGSGRVDSISQTDGSLISILYDGSGRVETLTETAATGVTRITTLAYFTGYSTVTDPQGAVTTLTYNAKGELTQLTLPAPVTGGTAQIQSFAYLANGDVTSVTDGAGKVTTYQYDVNGNQKLSRDASGNTVERTYDLATNALLTETTYLVADPDGAGTRPAAVPLTTRYTYDSEDHLRYVVSAEGRVTEFRYNGSGQRVSEIAYRGAAYDVSGLGVTVGISEASLNSWVSAIADRSATTRTDTFYDFRGNVSRTVSHSSVSIFGETSNSPLAITPGANTSVSQLPNGTYRISKTSGSATAWDAEAHSSVRTDGDFVLRISPPATGSARSGGVATVPTANSTYGNLQYGFHFLADGSVYAMENGSAFQLGTYAAGDNFWLVRTGSTINYYRGSTLAIAQAAGSLRNSPGVAGNYFFDSSLYSANAALDVEFTPLDIVNGVGTSVVQQPDGLFRVTKTGAVVNYDADARSTIKAEADFVLRLRPGQGNKAFLAGVSTAPGTSASFSDLAFSFNFLTSGTFQYMESSLQANLGTYTANDNFWLVRSGTTINYYKGASLESAVAAGSLRTRTGITGTFYFDSSLRDPGTVVDVDFKPAPIVNGVGTSVVQQADGLYRITKTGALTAWDADGRSTSRAESDFVLRLRPGQADKNVVAGVAADPASASYTDVNYGIYFKNDGTVLENLFWTSLGTYAAGDNFWIVRTGGTINYYKGATLESAMAAGSLGAREGVTGAYFFDSSFNHNGAFLDVGFSGSAVTTTDYVYDPAGNLLSRLKGNFAPETFIYDGLGRMIGSTDSSNQSTSFAFNDSAGTSVVTLANGLTQTSTYNRAGELISYVETATPGGSALTSFVYDSLGRLRWTVDATGQRTYVLYDRLGRKTADIEADGSMTEYGYTTNNLVNRTIRYATRIDVGLLVDSNGNPSNATVDTVRPTALDADRWEWNIYDNAGRLIQTIDGVGATSIYSYDGASRLLSTTSYNALLSANLAAWKVTPPSLLALPVTDSAKDRAVRNFYDKDGLLVGTLDAEGYLTHNIYDKAGLKTQAIAYAAAAAIAFRAGGSFDELLASVTPTTTNNLLANPLLLAGTTGWTLTNVERIAGSATDPLPFLFRNVSTELVANANTVTAPLPIGDRFTLSYMVKPGVTQQLFQTVVRWFDASGGLAGIKTFEQNPTDTANFTTYTEQLTRPANAVSFLIESAAAAGATALWGGHRLTEANVIANPDLATDTTGWTLFNAQRVAGASGDPAPYFFQSSSEGFASSDSSLAPVPAATTLDLTYSLKAGTFGQSFVAGIRWFDASGALISQSAVSTSNTTQFTTYQRQVTKPAGAVTYNVWVQTAGGIGTWGGFRLAPAQVSGVLNPDDVRSHYVYDGRGLLLAAVDGEGNLTRYRYADRTGLLEQETRGQKLDAIALRYAPPRLETLPAPGATETLEMIGYARNGAGDVTTETRTLASGAAETTTYSYDKLRKLLATTVNGAGDSRTWNKRYDIFGRLIGELPGEGNAALAALGSNPTAAAVDTVYRTWGKTYAYDSAGRLVSMTTPNGVDANANRTLFYYDSEDRLRYEINAKGEVVEHVYDSLGNRTDTYRYDTRIEATTLSGLNGGVSLGALAAVTANSLADSRTQFEYNVTGTLTRSTDALSNVTTYGYNAFREMTSRVDPLDSTNPAITASSAFGYDRRGLLKSETRDSAGGLQLLTSFGYDAFGRRTSETDPALELRKTAYDRIGRVVSRTDAANAVERFTYDARGNMLTSTDRTNKVTTYTYDRFNRKVTMTTPEGLTITTIRNAHGERTDVTQTVMIVPGPAPDVTTTTTYGYDKNGNLKTVTDAAGQRVNNYDKAGRLFEEIDGRGIKTSYSHDAANRIVTRKVDDGGLNLTTTYEYDGQGRQFLITDPTDMVTKVEFDKKGRQTAVIVDYGTAAGKLNLKTEYTYDPQDRVLKVIEGAGTDDARGTTYEYDKAGRVVDSWVDKATGGLNLRTHYLYDKNGNVLNVTDPAGRVTVNTYDDENRLKFTADAAGRLTETIYDAEGRVSAVRRYAALASLTQTGVDNGIAKYSLTPPAGSFVGEVTSYVYDDDGRLRFKIDPLGQTCEYVYDGLGNLLSTREYAAPIALASTYSELYVEGQVALLPARINWSVYDSAGRETYSIDSAGGVTALVYDAASNVVKRTVFKDFYTGDRTPANFQAWVAAQPTASARVIRAIYDRASRIVYEAQETADAQNPSYVTEFQYDGAGRLSKRIRYAGKYAIADTTTQATMPALGAQTAAAVTSYTHDKAGRLTDIVDASLNRTHHDYDKTGLIKETKTAYLTADESSVQNTYDKAGRLTDTVDGELSRTHFVLDASGLITDTYVAYQTADESRTHRVFDATGRLSSETGAWLTAEASTTGYTYDNFGRLRTVTDGRNFTTQYDYDAAGRVIKETVPLGSGQTAVTEKYYDAFGNLVKVKDPRNNLGYFYYDGMGRLTLQGDPEGYATKTVYTVGGEVKSVTRYSNPFSGWTEASPPDIPTNAPGATTAFTHDRLERLTGVTDAENYAQTYVLDAFGSRESVTRTIKLAVAQTPAVTATTTYTYDKLGRQVTETLPASSIKADGTVQSTSIVNKFEYDGRGNRKTLIEGLGLAEVRTTTFVYDKVDRLIEKKGDSVLVTGQDMETAPTPVAPTETYKYDKRGNLIETLTSGGSRTLHFYDDLNRKTKEVVKVEVVSGVAKGAFSEWFYDDNGNVEKTRVYGDLIDVPAQAGGPGPSVTSTNRRETLYEYDGSDRLTKTTIAGLLTGEYGANYVKSSDGVLTELSYDKAGNVTVEKDGRGNSAYNFYDKLGRRVARVDQENYLTIYTVNGDGNVTKEERFARQLTVAVTVDSVLSDLRANAAIPANVNDRVTEFVYDLNGRRTHEKRLNVDGKKLDVYGALIADAAHSEIRYEYNGLGLVVKKTEANGDTTEYGYDSIGRQTSVQGAEYSHYAGGLARRKTDTYYNGLGEVTRSIDRSKNDVAANNRVTTYSYGAGGRLQSVTDASGFTRAYGYDVDGRVVKESYDRLKSSDLTTYHNEGIAYRYDFAGRLTFQANATDTGPSWSFGDSTHLRYNAYGEVTGKGINGIYQETFEYDAGGRLWRSNSGDGSAKIYLYDKAGNVSLTLASSGTADLSTIAFADAAATITGGETSIVGAVTTISVYDKRGQEVATREPGRQLSSSPPSVTLVRSRAYNAFGEVTQEVSARGNATADPTDDYVTNYTYNSMGRLTKLERPKTNYTSATGVVFTGVRPTENYTYDLSGRLIGVQDANGNLTTRKLLAGTGYGDSEATVLTEYHPGTLGNFQRLVDEFGDVRVERNELYDGTNATVSDQDMTYDKMGRLITLEHRGNLLTDSYVYDGLGQRIRHTNNFDFLTSDDFERTDYDLQGRVTKTIAFGGDVVDTAYEWLPTLSVSGIGSVGGWKVTATFKNFKTTIEQSGTFGHMVSRKDLGGNVFSFGYDEAGRRTSQAVTGETLNYTYFNTGLMASIVSNAVGSSSQFGYDADGNRTSEWTQRASVVVQNATAQYDALGRMTAWAEAGNGTNSTGSPPATIAYEYDLNGNIRHSLATYRIIGANGNAGSTTETQDFWFAYNERNWLVIDKGVSGVAHGYSGVTYSYRKDGQRATSSSTKKAEYQFLNNENGTYITRYQDIHNAELFKYSVDGTLSEVWISQDEFGSTGYVPGTLQLHSTHDYDAMGRLTHQVDGFPGFMDVWDRAITYNDKGQVTSETVFSRQLTDYYKNVSTHQYGSGSSYALGAVVSTTVDAYKWNNGAYRDDENLAPDTSTTNTFEWWDGAVQDTIVHHPDSNKTWTTGFNYSPSGQLLSASVDDERDRTVTFVNDMSGQVLRRDEAHLNPAITAGDPHEIWYRFNGKQVGFTGNNGTTDKNYLDSIYDRARKPINVQNSTFRYGDTGPTTHVDFAQSMDPINSFAQGSSGGSYTARAGDTLQNIASALWGDSSLWYKLADANGMSGSAALVDGQRLTIPVGVSKVTHNASTFRPYDPAKVIGDLSPTTPKPTKPGGCGIMGKLILVAIAVAVTVITSGAALAALAPTATAAAGGGILGGISAFTAASAGTAAMITAGAVGGAVGSIVSQGVGVATRLQDKFSWKGVGMAALAGAVSAGLGKFAALSKVGAAGEAAGKVIANGKSVAAGAKIGGVLGKVGRVLGQTGFVGGAARGVASSMITQGIGVATKMQKRFDWTGVAAAGIGGGASAEVGGALGSLNKYEAQMIAGGVGAFYNAGVRSLIDGTDFGDNLIAALPDVIGSTIGNLIADGVAIAASERPKEKVRSAQYAKGAAEHVDIQQMTSAEMVTHYQQQFMQMVEEIDQPSVKFHSQETLENTEEEGLSKDFLVGSAWAEVVKGGTGSAIYTIYSQLARGKDAFGLLAEMNDYYSKKSRSIGQQMGRESVNHPSLARALANYIQAGANSNPELSKSLTAVYNDFEPMIHEDGYVTGSRVRAADAGFIAGARGVIRESLGPTGDMLKQAGMVGLRSFIPVATMNPGYDRELGRLSKLNNPRWQAAGSALLLTAYDVAAIADPSGLLPDRQGAIDRMGKRGLNLIIGFKDAAIGTGVALARAHDAGFINNNMMEAGAQTTKAVLGATEVITSATGARATVNLLRAPVTSVTAPVITVADAMPPIPKWVYRGDSRLESEIFRDGFSPRGTSTDLLAHAWDSQYPPSAYIPTSTTYRKATEYGDHVYVIRPPNGIDVNRALGLKSPYPADHEIAVLGKIQPQDIRAVTLPSQGISILNPGYRPR